jgi:hypothetical protein
MLTQPNRRRAPQAALPAPLQQMSISFGVATAGLATAFFVPSHAGSASSEMIHGIHKALLALGVLTVISAVVFRSLKQGDGATVSQQKVFHLGG